MMVAWQLVKKLLKRFQDSMWESNLKLLLKKVEKCDP